MSLKNSAEYVEMKLFLTIPSCTFFKKFILSQFLIILFKNIKKSNGIKNLIKAHGKDNDEE